MIANACEPSAARLESQIPKDGCASTPTAVKTQRWLRVSGLNVRSNSSQRERAEPMQILRRPCPRPASLIRERREPPLARDAAPGNGLTRWRGRAGRERRESNQSAVRGTKGSGGGRRRGAGGGDDV
jgi:hypothetical protein